MLTYVDIYRVNMYNLLCMIDFMAADFVNEKLSSCITNMNDYMADVKFWLMFSNQTKTKHLLSAVYHFKGVQRSGVWPKGMWM